MERVELKEIKLSKAVKNFMEGKQLYTKAGTTMYREFTPTLGNKGILEIIEADEYGTIFLERAC